ncbi:MAG: class I SAM-dependent methyltransferase [Clostridia bacterium]|nr:class I SAM-dependent methyltransferase [Clostridia bacterium]
MSYNSFAGVYDELTFNVDYKKRAEYVQSILHRYGVNDGLLLDLACGTGSMAVEFSKMGYEVIAIDASADMLMEAQTKAYDNEQSIMFLCQRMEETDLYGTVRAVVCALDSINHLPDAATMAQTFQVLKNFVDDGGVMVFDVNTLYKHQRVLADNTFVYDEKNVFLVWQNHLLQDNKTVNINLDFFCKDGELYERFNENFNEIAFTDEEITAAVEGAGFKVVERLAEMTGDAPCEETERVYYVIRREY